MALARRGLGGLGCLSPFPYIIAVGRAWLLQCAGSERCQQPAASEDVFPRGSICSLLTCSPALLTQPLSLAAPPRRHHTHANRYTYNIYLSQNICPLSSTLGKELSDSEVKAAIKQLDINANGFIEFIEFVNWWTGGVVPVDRPPTAATAAAAATTTTTSTQAAAKDAAS